MCAGTNDDSDRPVQFEGEPAEYLKSVLDRKWERLSSTLEDRE
jgi:hypothetical protein